MLALRVLGLGHAGFGPGADGGRDGYFEGEAPYPNDIDRWTSVWYIQSKFHKPHLSKDPQKWLLEWIVGQLLEYSRSDFERRQIISGLLSTWRERSQAPIQTANVQEMWLSQ